jgi:ubiquinone/menaquinone biosynthesis C-methylase UbiE
MDGRFTAFLISASGMTRGDRVPEVACGTGVSTIAFAERCMAAVGLEIRADAMARARLDALTRKVGNASFVAGELERMPLTDGSFTGAICRFSFHHFVHPERIFAEMARVVAHNGWMVVSDMTASNDPDQAGSSITGWSGSVTRPTPARSRPRSSSGCSPSTASASR